MAKPAKKPTYTGPRMKSDNAEERTKRAKRLEAALKNANERQTNAVFALQDTAFQQFCEQANVKPTARQASKFRNKYGAAAKAAGFTTRKTPVAA